MRREEAWWARSEGVGSIYHPDDTSREEVPLGERKTSWIRLAILVGLVVVVGWAWHHWALWPLKVVVVLFHELGHAVAAWLTGGEVVSIQLSPQEGGLTVTRGGWRVGILNAGYLGSLIAGLGLIAAGKRGLVARGVTGGLGVLLLAVVIFFVPMLTFGWWFTGVVGLALLVCAGLVPAIGLRWGLRGLGVFSVLYAFVDVWSDIFARAFDTTVRSDAVMLAQETGIPALVWGAVWVVLGVALLIGARRLLV